MVGWREYVDSEAGEAGRPRRPREMIAEKLSAAASQEVGKEEENLWPKLGYILKISSAFEALPSRDRV